MKIPEIGRAWDSVSGRMCHDLFGKFRPFNILNEQEVG
jgi:hypothetical protein